MQDGQRAGLGAGRGIGIAATGVRVATLADLDPLVRLLGSLFAIEADFELDPVRQRRGLERMLEAPAERCVMVAERSGRVIGMATVQLVVSTAEGGPAALVEDVIVEEPHRKSGVGRALLGALEEWAVVRGATRLQLLADRDNAPALAFYERIDWRPTRLICLRKSAV